MMLILATIGAIIMGVGGAKRPTVFAAVFLAFLPSYVIRFRVLGLPTTLLEFLFWGYMIGFFVSCWKHDREAPQKALRVLSTHYTPLAVLGCLIVASIIGVISAVDTWQALGAWRAFFLEPFLFLFPLLVAAKTHDGRQKLIVGLLCGGALVALAAAGQMVYPYGVPLAYAEADGTLRTTAWYGYPNAVGLFLAPLIPLIFSLSAKTWLRRLGYILLGLLFSTALVGSGGSGPVLGAAAGVLVILFIRTRKLRLPIVLATLSMVAIVVSLPQTHPIRQELFFTNWSGFVRTTMWAETVELIGDHPFRGSGLASYAERVAPYHVHKAIEIFHLPHNLLLAFWVQMGILGAVGVVWFFVVCIRIAVTEFSISGEEKRHVVGALGMLTTMAVMGLVDTPYFKNDLVFLFFIPFVFIVTSTYERAITHRREWDTRLKERTTKKS